MGFVLGNLANGDGAAFVSKRETAKLWKIFELLHSHGCSGADSDSALLV